MTSTYRPWLTGRTGTGTAGPAGPKGDKGDTGTAGATGPPGLTWRGDWDSATAYHTGDVVASDGSSYVAVSPSTDGVPPGPNWELLAAKGDPG